MRAFFGEIEHLVQPALVQREWRTGTRGRNRAGYVPQTLTQLRRLTLIALLLDLVCGVAPGYPAFQIGPEKRDALRPGRLRKEPRAQLRGSDRVRLSHHQFGAAVESVHAHRDGKREQQ